MKALDLFSGAGGFSLGLKRAGFDVCGAIELDQYAVATYKHNFPETPVYQASVESFSDEWYINNFKSIDLVCGGPPCQGFSVAGPSQFGITDPRNGLILEMARVVELLKPKAVILENVKGILRGKLGCGNKAIDKYFQKLTNLGYETKVYKLQATNYGVPQQRERVFLISIYKGSTFPLLEATHGIGLKPYLTVEEAISDLPNIEHGSTYSPDDGYPTSIMSPFQQEIRQGSNKVHNHEAMKHSKRVFERIKSIPQGGSMKDVEEEHGQRERNTHKIDGKKKRYKMNYSRVSLSKPSIAVTANFQTIHVHPTQNRMLTAREGARLQTFPDSYEFLGPRTLPSKKLLEREGRGHLIGLSQYNQIGNAVPPLLAYKIANELKEILDGQHGK
jgi:DNA (cytosine-5)-methyltransferase 1